jgi:hypothetical protein
MMKVAPLILAAALLTACEAIPVETLPEGVSAADVALFQSAVTNAGCTISTPDTAALVERQTGFDTDKLRSITQYLTLAGQSEPVPSGFRLTSGQCANA